MEVRICTGCQQELPIEKFYRKKRPDGKIQIDSKCKACVIGRNKAYYERHKEQYQAYNREYHQSHKEERRAYYAAHRDRINELQRAGYWRNPEKRRANSARWRKVHPLWNRVNVINARARRNGLTGRITAEQLRNKIEYYGWQCYYCGEELSIATLHTDHRIPVSRGGYGFIANIVPCCEICNRAKFTKKEEEFKSVS